MKSKNYMLDTLSLNLKGYGNIHHAPLSTKVSTPPLFAGDRTDVKSLQASGSFGTLRFHEMTSNNYSIRQNEFRLNQDGTLFTSIDSHSLGFHYTLKNDIRFIINGFPEGLIMKHQYNMVYVPRVAWEYVFRKNQDYACFGIHFTPEYLNKFNKPFHLLPEFLMNVRHKRSTIISPNHLSATPEMVAIIQSILHCDYVGTLKTIYLDIKVPELLLLSLQQIPSNVNYVLHVNLKEDDKRKIRDAREYLTLHMDDPGSLQKIAHQVGINEFKLKNGFKKMYNTTVFAFLLEIRMEKAKQLLRDTKMPIQEIASVTGYKNLSNFTTAFKKKFNYTPSSLR